MARLIQPSFGKGEVGDDLHGRVDTAAYQSALATARNVIIRAQGGVERRPGTGFIGPVKDHTVVSRLIRFRFKTTDAYVLEFGNLYMRVIREDGHVLETAVNITGATVANPVVVTAVAHGYANGDEVYITGVVGMTEINDQRFVVADKTDDTFELTNQVTGTDINGSAFTAYSSGGTVDKVFELATPYLTADLFNIKFTQSADVMTLTHATYGARELTRTDHDAWTLTEPTFAPAQTHPTGITVTVDGADNGVTYFYRVTALADETLEESLSGTNNTSQAITGATVADPVVITSVAHGFVNGDEVYIESVGGMTEINDRRFTVAGKTDDTFQLEGEDGSGHTAYTSGGTAKLTFVTTAVGTTAADNTIAWTAAAGAQKYAVYRKDENDLYGLIGETEDTTFKDSGKTPDLDSSPPRDFNPFLSSGNFPGTVSYYEQRRVMGGSTNNPDTKYYSQTGNHSNFTSSSPAAADDGMTAALNALEVNEIRHFVPGNDLLVLTSGGEWRINSGADTGFSIDTLKQKPQSYWGCSHLRPLTIGNTTLFAEDGSATVRSLGYSLSVDGYTGTDMTILAPHLFETYTIKDWTFGRAPDPVIYGVRTDGDATVLTFHQEQEVVAWARWDTLGKFESVTSIRTDHDPLNDTIYYIVKRLINGNIVRYIEHIHRNTFTDVRDAYFVDCGLTLDSPLTISGATAANPVVITATAHGFSDGDEIDIFGIEWVADFDSEDNETQPDQLNTRRYFAADVATDTFALVNQNNPVTMTGATQANPIVVTAAGHGFSDGDMVAFLSVAGMTDLNGNTYKISSATTDTFELTTAGDVDIDSTGFGAYTSGGKVYNCEDGTAFNAYVEGGTAREAVLVISGLRHLESTAVEVLADGNAVPGLTVSATGTLTLTRRASRVHIGLKYISDVETLNPEAPQGTIQGLKQKVAAVIVRFKRSRGLLVGPSSDKLVEMKQREFEKMSDPTALLTGDKRVVLLPDWNSNGRVFLRQRYPLPMHILAIMRDIEIADD